MAFVRAAFALLNKSIIRVEQPDINLEPEQAVVAIAGDTESAMEVDEVSTFDKFTDYEYNALYVFVFLML